MSVGQAVGEGPAVGVQEWKPTPHPPIYFPPSLKRLSPPPGSTQPCAPCLPHLSLQAAAMCMSRLAKMSARHMGNHGFR